MSLKVFTFHLLLFNMKSYGNIISFILNSRKNSYDPQVAIAVFPIQMFIDINNVLLK